jgi:hypothetical protein
MEKRKQVKKKGEGPLLGFVSSVGFDKEALDDLMTEQLLVEYDLSAAFHDLHKNQ